MLNLIKRVIKHDRNAGHVFNGSYAEIEGRHRQLWALIARKWERRYEWERDDADWWILTFETGRGGESTFHMRVPRKDLVAFAERIVQELGYEYE